MQIGYCLHVKNSADAVEFYHEVFGLTLGYHVKNPDGSYYHSELYKDGKEVMDVVEAQSDGGAEHRVQLGVTLADASAVDKAFALLREGGTIITPMGPLPWSPCAAEVIDKFGVWWFITAPMHQPPEEFDPSAPWDASTYQKPDESR